MRPIDADIKVSDYIETWQCKCSENGTQTVMAVEDLQYLPTLDPIRAAGGCYCRECRHYGPGPFGYGCHTMFDGRAAVIPYKPDHFCGDGEPREEQDDG